MDIYEMIRTNRERIRSVYDLAAVAYDHLIQHIDNQILFVGGYLSFSDSAVQNNPNLGMLMAFSDRIKRLLYDARYWKNDLLDEILADIALVQKQLKAFKKESYNQATVAYYLILGIDLYLEYGTKNSQRAPLNRCYQENSFVYRCQKESMIAKAAKENAFRKKIKTVEIRNGFSCLRFLGRTELEQGMNPPEMVTLYISEKDFERKSIIQGKELVIACIPFGQEKISTFHKTVGDVFSVRYSDKHKSEGSKRALRLLKEAILSGANIIVFPEYVCDPDLQESIGRYLRETYRDHPNILQELFLVVAGSGWTQDDNNVSIVYSYNGKRLGEQYKYAAYDNVDKDGERWIEGLSDPGKESVITEVPGIGRVAVSICRDISNRDLTERMARIFCVDFLIVPAWSESLRHAFLNQLKSITETNMNTCSVVCNCCIPMPADRIEKGLAVTPYKEDSLVVGNPCPFGPKQEDAAGCQKCTDCLFCLTISFRTQDVAEGKMVRFVDQYKI